MLDAEKTDTTSTVPFVSPARTGDDDQMSRVELPPVPEELRGDPVAAWAEPLVIDTYMPTEPSQFPEFFDYRVYQGSSGRVYPLPFHERISQTKAPHTWQAVHLENEWVRLVILPELGGRIYIGYDKSADYDFFYRNNVIKPALVGLAGPWLSGGVEFNWPQHHRPATFLPTDWSIEHEEDGSVTVWCSDHDPFTRMKGMHGIRLSPHSSVVEARVRLYNRTSTTQTFLWWANVAAAVNDDYQSFFPTDVQFVADHARRAITSFPRVDGDYYGVDYPSRVTPERPDGDRLDWYRNIPVPTSYMVLSTEDDFFGGYDHGRKAGFIHVADRAIAPGKKQWTWGNDEFGWAWDRNLTDDDGPYVELMAGVFTDNQPDFTFIAPGETKTFSQYWYPFRDIGPVHQANREAAVRFDVEPGADATVIGLGLAVTHPLHSLRVVISDDTGTVYEADAVGTPDSPLLLRAELPGRFAPHDLRLSVLEAGREVIGWRPRPVTAQLPPAPATEPARPSEVGTNDELFYTGQYLEQYRHATRHPDGYWSEALERDPGDVRSNLALGALLDDRYRLVEAERHFRVALDRLLHRVPNPADGEAHYRLGVNLVRQGRDAEALEVLAKAAWTSAWRVPAGYAAAAIHARRAEWVLTEVSLRDVLRLDSEHLQATCLLAVILRRLHRHAEADALLEAQVRRDPLDQWSRHLLGLPLTTDAPTLLDVALEYAAAGCARAALDVLDLALEASGDTALGQVQVAPLVHYHRAAILLGLGCDTEADAALSAATTSDARHCHPSRLEDVAALVTALERNPGDARAAALLGDWHYDKANYAEAIAFWRRAAEGELGDDEAAIVHRNLGIAEFNILGDPAAAREQFETAIFYLPGDAKLLYEYDQLCSRTGESEAFRLSRLLAQPGLVASRDDLSVVFADLLSAGGTPEAAREVLLGRVFQPWEGGEGQVLASWERANSAIASSRLAAGDAAGAVRAALDALTPPRTLGEARHALANTADLHWMLGEAFAAAGDERSARIAWTEAASASGDFTGMRTHPFSVKTFSSIRALRRLGRDAEAERLVDAVRDYVADLREKPATIDFFATSLPALLTFHEDPATSRDRLVRDLEHQLALVTS
ncbi:DUF5107 domain-containing protein [Diaminobutyricibacter tongyongensis]|uniref:DUF5107 domain-containing protein n=1 Tax=Leifsonia tongyongensis TaxID=1268043 RepID=A0A6L9XXW3_9MICO|nr:DUF5107 domain-containing protein [Diaminobutyricibacter tongyongensis]NEN06243.1 DUF5107 domain-containing protein [Diaminobutyricibacter tongyongensis]